MLQLETARFYRVKRGQTARQIEKVLNIPANCCFEGAIIVVEKCTPYVVQPFETYASIAKKFRTEEAALKKFNGNRPLYPACKIFIPAHAADFHS